ncbi:MAG: Hpt domain-containing protein [bacterium]
MSENNIVYVDSDLEDLIPGFMENRHKDVEKINNLLAGNNLEEIQRLGHSMKGAGGGYGFDEISEIGKQLEAAAKDGNKDVIDHLNNLLKQYISNVTVVYQDDD